MKLLARLASLLAATPQSIGGCTVNDAYGRPSVRIMQPAPAIHLDASAGGWAEIVPGTRRAGRTCRSVRPAAGSDLMGCTLRPYQQAGGSQLRDPQAAADPADRGAHRRREDGHDRRDGAARPDHRPAVHRHLPRREIALQIAAAIERQAP